MWVSSSTPRISCGNSWIRYRPRAISRTKSMMSTSKTPRYSGTSCGVAASCRRSLAHRENAAESLLGGLNRDQLMIRTRQLHVLVDLRHQVRTVLCKQRQHRVKPLLQMLPRIHETVQRCRGSHSKLITHQNLPGHLALQLVHLVFHLSLAALGSFRE